MRISKLNDMLNNGIEKVNGQTFQTFIDDEYVYYFEFEVIETTEYDNKGDGDIPYELKSYYLTSLEYRWHIEDEYMETYNDQDVFNLCKAVYEN